MWLHSSTSSRIACLGLACTLPFVVGCALDDLVDDLTHGMVQGYIGAAEPIVGASIDIYTVDLVTGDTSMYPVLTVPTVSDPDGEFEFPNNELSGPLLFLARSGQLTEYWSDEAAELPGSHLTAVVADWIPGSTTPITITPWTSLTHSLAMARTQNGETETFHEAVRESEALLYEHFIADPSKYGSKQCVASLHCLRPTKSSLIAEAALNSPESDRYALSLLSLSALAAEAVEAHSFMTPSFTSVQMTVDHLAIDASDGRFDGRPDTAVPQVTPHTLRSELGRAFARHYLDQSKDTYSDFQYALERIAGNDDPELFGAIGPEPIDATAPSLLILPSALYDERHDQILFTENRDPVHVHSASHQIALDTLFDGFCPEIHKHINLLAQGAADSNPLQWRFLALDDTSGIARVEATISFEPAYSPQYPIRVELSEQQQVDGGYEVVVGALSTDVPDLASREANVQITVTAIDHAGNQSTPFSGCWRHVPRAAPLWVSPVRTSGDPRLLSAYSLQDNNLAPALRADRLWLETPALGLFEVYNPNQQPVYLVMNTTPVSGHYTWTWNYHYDSPVFDERVDSCLQLGTCTTVPPQPGDVVPTVPNPPIPPSNTPLVVDGQQCIDCSDTLLALRPRETLIVAMYWTDFGLLVPGDIDLSMISDTVLDPVGGTGFATGVDTTYIHCELVGLNGTCSRRVFYRQRTTLQAARLVTRAFVQGVTSPSAAAPLRRPVPGAYSFATFGRDHEFAHDWITLEN